MRAFAATVASAVIVLAWPASAMALDGPSPTCNQGSCVGWFNGAGVPVAVSWSAPAGASLTDCHFETITADTSGTNVSCGAYYAAQQQTVTVTVTVRRDTTPPQVTSVSPARAPDANGWYNHAVALTFAGSDATSGIASCGAPTYSGPDSGSASVVGVCRDVAGNTSAPLAFALKYDATAPAAGASLARGPDANGWYSKPITVSFAGSDATSGIASCTAPATYCRAGRRRRERRRQLHGRCRQPHLCGGVDSVRLHGAERRRRPGPAARRERLVFQAALHHLQGQRRGLGRRLVHAPDPLRTPRRRRRQGHGNVSGRGRQRELAGDDVLQVRCDSTDGTGGEDRRRRWQRHTRMGRRDRRGKLRGPARVGREARPRIGAVAWHRPPLRRPLGQERDALPLCRSRPRPGREYRRQERRRDAAAARLRAGSGNGDPRRPARSLGCRSEGALLQRPGLPWPHEGAQPLAHDEPVPDSSVLGLQRPSSDARAGDGIASSSGPRSDRPSIHGTGSSWVRRASSGRRERGSRRPGPRG